MIFQFIAECASRYRLASLCRVLGVSRSGYYAWRLGHVSGRQQANDTLVRRIVEIHHQNRQVYGSPRIWKALTQQGETCARKRVARLMRLHDIRAKTKRRFKVTTRSRSDRPVSPDLVKRQFYSAAPDRVWTTDITYVQTREGWVYLAVILDLYSRMIVGWELSDHMTTELVTSALVRALDHRRPPKDLILHSDRGSQFSSRELAMLADRHDIRLSMGAQGSCYDNAVTESFFHTLKTELTQFERYVSRQEARQSIFDYIEVFYNRQRLHSTIGFISPQQYEKQYSSP
jgi:putative transposase